MSDRIALNQIRLICNDGDRGSIRVLSTFDKTERMEHKTDESISFPDDHIVVIKNVRESASIIRLESIRIASGKQFVLKSSRQATKRLWSKDDSEIKSRTAFALGGGESLVIRTTAWKAQKGLGANVGSV